MGPPNATATLGGSSEPTRAAAGEQASVSAGDHTLVAGTTEQQQPSEEQDAQMNDDVAPSPSEEQDAQMNIDVVQKELEQPSLRVEDPQSSSTTSTCVFKQKEAPELPPTSVLEQKEAEVALPDSSDPGLHQNDEPVILHIPTTIENPADVSGIDAEFASELLQLQRNTFFNRDVVSQEDPDFKERIEGVKDEARPSLLHLDGRPDSRELDDDEEGTARKRPRFDTAEEPVEGHRNKACTPTTPIDRTTAQGGEDLLPVLKTPIGTPGGRETPFDSASSRRHPLGTPGGSGLRSCLKSGGKSPRPGTARNSKVGGPRPRVHFSSARRNKRGGGGSHVVKNCNIPDQIAGEETNKKAPPPASAATLALAELRGDDENLGPGGGGDKSTSNKEDLQVQGEDDDHLKDENVLGAPGGGGWLDYSFSSAAASPVEPTGSGGGGGLLHHVGRLLWSANNSANGGSAKGSSSNNNSVNSSSSAPNKGPPNTGPSSSSSSCAGSPPAVVSPHLLHLPATCSGKEAGLSSASAGNVRFGVVELPPIEEEIEAGGLVERNEKKTDVAAEGTIAEGSENAEKKTDVAAEGTIAEGSDNPEKKAEVAAEETIASAPPAVASASSSSSSSFAGACSIKDPSNTKAPDPPRSRRNSLSRRVVNFPDIPDSQPDEDPGGLMLTDITGQPLGSASSSATSHKNNIMVNNGATTSTGTRRASLLPGAAPTGGGPVAGSSMSDPADKKIANSASPFRHARCSLSISMVSHNSSVHADVREFEVSSILHDDSEAELSSNLWRLREQQEIPEDAEVPCPLPYTIHGEVVDEVENRSLDVRKLSKLEAGQKLELDAPQEGGLSSSSGPQGGGIVIASSPVDQAATASFLKLNTTEDDHDDEHASAFEAVVLMGQASSIREDNQTLGEAKAEEQRRTRVSSKSGANYVGTGPRDPTSSTAAGPPDPTSSAAKNAALGGTTTEGAAPRPPSSTTSVNYDMPPPRRARRSSCAGAGFERPQLEAATATNNSSQKTLVKEVPLPVLENDIEGDVPPPPAKRSRRHSISSFASAGVSNPQLDEGMIAPSQGDWQGSSQIHSQNTSRIMGPPPRSSARGRRSSGAGGPGVDFSTLSSRVLGGTPSATGGGRGMLAGLSDVEVQILEDDGDEVNKKDEPRPREQDQKRHISKPPELDGQAGAQENQSCSALPTPPAQSQHVEHNSCSSKSIATPVFGTGGASKSSRGGDAAVVFVPKNNLDISFGAACSSQGDPVSEPRTNSNKMKMQRAGGDGGIDTVAGVNKTGLERGQGDSCGGNEKLGGPRANSGAPSFGGGGSQASQPSDLVVGSASSSRVVVPAAYQPQQPSPVSPPAGARNFKNLTTTAALAAPGQVGASSSSGSSANKTSKMPIQDVLSSLRQNTVSPGLSRLRAPGFVVSKIKSALFQTAGGDGSGGQLCASAASSSAGPAPVAQFGTTAPAAPPAASTTTRAAGGLASSPRDEGKMSNMRAAIQSIFSPRAPPGGGLGGADPPGRGSQQGGLGSQLRHFISPGGAASRRRSSRFSLLELSPIAAVSTCELNESHSLNNSLFMAQPERGSGTSRASALVDELARNSKILKNQEGEQNQMNKMAAFSSVARNLVFNAPPDAGDAEFAANGKNARIEIEDEDELDEQKDPQAKRRIQDTGGAVALDDPFASNEPDVPASGGAKEVVEDLTQQLKRLHSRSRSISGDFFSPVPAVPPGPSVEQAVENVSSGPKKNVAAAVVVAPPSGSSVRAVVGKSTSSAKALQPNNVANKAPRLVGGCALSSTAPPPVSSSSQMHKNGPSALTKKPQPLLHQQKTAQLHPSTGTPSLLHQQKSTQLHPSSGIGTTGTGATGTSTTFFSSKMKNLNLTPSRYMTPAHKSASCTAYGGLYNPPQRSTPALIRPSILDTASLDDLLAARDSKGPPAGLLRCTCGRVHRMKRPCHAHPPTKGK